MSDDFLNRLVGSWNLTGTMGSTKLRQRVDARWVVQGRFLEVHCMQEGPVSPGQTPYEAIYMIGYDDQSGEYSMHLFDTFGVSYAQTVGIGTRHEGSVEFLFNYPNGPFSNTFAWNRETDGWEMLLRQREESGEWRVFAKKTLERD